MKRYTFVLLDVGETLVGPRESFGSVYAQVLDTMGLELPAEILERSLRQVWVEMERLVPPGEDRYAHFPGGEAEYWRRFASLTLEKAAGHPVEDLFVDQMLKHGYSEGDCANVLGGNILWVFEKVWDASTVAISDQVEFHEGWR